MGVDIKKIVRSVIKENTENHYFNGENEGLQKLNTLKSQIERNIKKAYKKITNSELSLPKVKIKIDDNIKDGKIAGFNHPDEDNPYGVMGIKSKALDDMEYLKWVITHELIHSAVGEDLPSHEEHEGLFDLLADELGLPEEYRD